MERDGLQHVGVIGCGKREGGGQRGNFLCDVGGGREGVREGTYCVMWISLFGCPTEKCF